MQVITLGGETLPTESRSFTAFGKNLISISGRSADGTLHEDYTAIKKTFTLQYKVITETTRSLVDSIFSAQVSNSTFPTLTYTDEDDIIHSFTVRMSPPQYGALIPKDAFYYQGVTISLEEV